MLMKLQARPWTCGPASVRNALCCFGKKVSEAKVRKVAGTINVGEDKGTDEVGIINAVRHFGFTANEHRFNKKNVAWDWLQETLNSGKVAILCVDGWDHWVVAIGTLGKTGVVVFDPSNESENKKESGCLLLNRRKLINRWYNHREEDNQEEVEEDRIYAISIGKK